jgi:hypothetical protein
MKSFETPRGVRIGEKIFASLELFLFAPAAILIAGVMPGGMIWGIFPDLWWLGLVVGLFFGLYVLRIVWHGFLGRLRFCIQFHPDYLIIGRGLARCRFAYDYVEKIAIPRLNQLSKNKDIFIEISCMKNEAIVYLSNESFYECLKLLKESCANALYIDPSGNEHLPNNANNPDFTLGVLRKHYRKTIIAWAGLFLFASVFAITYGFGVFNWWRGNIGREFGTSIIFRFCIFTSLMIASIYQIIMYKMKSSLLSSKIKEVHLEDKSSNDIVSTDV